MTAVGGRNGGKEGFKEKQKGAEGKVYSRKSFKGLEDSRKMSDGSLFKESQVDFGLLSGEDGGLLQKSMLAVDSGDSSSRNRAVGNREVTSGNEMGQAGFLRLENRVTINLSMKSMREVRELRRKLESELNEIRSLLNKLNSEEGQKAGNGGRAQESVGKLKRVHSEVGSVGSPRIPKPLNELGVSVQDNSLGGSGSMKKEKQGAKVNQVKKPKEKFHSSKTKKSKSNEKKGERVESAPLVGSGKFPNKVAKSCGALLDKLMKHKHGWVFNKPVDIVALGLNDYFDIIKNPMDLDTIKTRLSKNWYKSPEEFAEDVRLTFRNAMTYNPKGHDVHVMAECLSKIFEDKWPTIEADYVRELKSQGDHDDGMPTPASKKAPPACMSPPDMKRPVSRTEPDTQKVDPKAKAGRTAAPKKPKAKEPNKREMTYDEKQKLSENLQSLPSDKLENVVQIIKRRNPSLCQNDDEIEVDIDNVDIETLWELDRFVTNYKKSLSKVKRQTELANQPKVGIATTIEDKNPAPAAVDALRETSMETLPQSPMGKKGENANKSTKLSASSSDLGSSSEDSDSRSSSSIGSDV